MNIWNEEDTREQRATNGQNLALERGDRRDGLGLVESGLREESHKRRALQVNINSMPSGFQVSEVSSSSIEGYTPKDVANL
ncbi:MAG: hypothetical protein M1812_003092 [Candelaria pacifica]|nr:MAG: hypothetical protein M1812_003092 [Candelaria pacifica]